MISPRDEDSSAFERVTRDIAYPALCGSIVRNVGARVARLVRVSHGWCARGTQSEAPFPVDLAARAQSALPAEAVER